ncbi:Rha family transcriptional regulator [Bacillus thuringiensis]|uniref:Rha family transcriptional regulator n=1 Tax=Bacillus thuringiensis TaxID=1428 RepID=UPI00214FE3E9|nr:Rha family transcriptional regulator [Bacillus thuringiensis]MDA2420171.1 Rha family transcriptional regulator [Bacillus cereus]MEB9693394.1 Rha family transcriptional regulator [Bacillus cereus]
MFPVRDISSIGSTFFNFVFIENNEVVTDSKKVAEVFGKRHAHVLDVIESLKVDMIKTDFSVLFQETTYKPENAKCSFPKYNLTRDGFTLLVMGFTGKKALQFKMMYINEFNRMESELKKLVTTPQYALPTTYKEAFIIDAKVREEHLHRVDVLEKVKGLLLLPNIEMATTRQVADFYGVSRELIGVTVSNNREELVSDGYEVMSERDLVSKFNLEAKSQRGYILLNDGSKRSYTEVGLFPRRAILRVGMLLRDSEVVKAVRKQLLNIEEKTTNEVKVADINEELLFSVFISLNGINSL